MVVKAPRPLDTVYWKLSTVGIAVTTKVPLNPAGTTPVTMTLCPTTKLWGAAVTRVVVVPAYSALTMLTAVYWHTPCSWVRESTPYEVVDRVPGV